jgi:hypothetical protein
LKGEPNYPYGKSIKSPSIIRDVASDSYYLVTPSDYQRFADKTSFDQCQFNPAIVKDGNIADFTVGKTELPVIDVNRPQTL